MALTIKNCSIVKMTGKDDIINNGYIIIDGGKIKKVGSGEPPAETEGKFIDGSGTVALPGLINTHTHCSMTLLRGYGEGLPLMRWLTEKIWPFESKLTPDDIYEGARLASLEMIKSGTTCFVDMYFSEDRVCQAIQESGIRGVIGSAIIGDSWKKELDIFPEFYHKYNNSHEGRVGVLLSPHAPYTCSEDALKAIANLAQQIGCGVNIHIAETIDEARQIEEKYSASPVEFLEATGLLDCSSVIGAHCVHVDERDMDILKKHNVNVAHCPQSNMKLSSGISPVWKMLSSGINVSLGTDGTSSNNNLDMIEEMQTASYLQKLFTGDATALPPYCCLEMATINGAKALHMTDCLGSIEEGKKADIILIDIDKPHFIPLHDLCANIVYSGSGRDVKTVIVDGKILMKDYEVLTLDQEKIMYESKRKVEQLLKR